MPTMAVNVTAMTFRMLSDDEQDGPSQARKCMVMEHVSRSCVVS